MSEDDRPGYAFDPGPPPEASAFLRAKGLAPSFRWSDVEPEEHAVAFAVAGVAEADVLEDIRGVVRRALDEGRTIEAFRGDLRETLQAKGWWGPRTVVDPLTGERRLVDLSSPRRVRTIYRANLRSARAAGQWERIERTRDALPWLEYRLGPSEVHREEHAALEGTILAADDPFWATHFPPNGWGCKCWVRQLSSRQAERRGGVSAPPEVTTRPWENPRTGEVRDVPVGVDPGWDRNPGAMRLAGVERLLADRLEGMAPAAAEAALRDVAGSWRARRMLEVGAPGSVPVAQIPVADAGAVGVARRIVRLGEGTAAKIRTRHPEVGSDLLEAIRAQIGAAPVALDGQGARPALVYNLPGLPGRLPLRLVVKAVAEGGVQELWVSTLHEWRPRQWETLLSTDGVRLLR